MQFKIPGVSSIFMGERSMSTFRRFVQDDSGATAIEYGLIAALVSVAIIVALGTLGENLNNTFSTVANELGAAANNAASPAP
jgi:pilus assembly protein Flp/PilA